MRVLRWPRETPWQGSAAGENPERQHSITAVCLTPPFLPFSVFRSPPFPPSLPHKPFLPPARGPTALDHAIQPTPAARGARRGQTARHKCTTRTLYCGGPGDLFTRTPTMTPNKDPNRWYIRRALAAVIDERNSRKGIFSFLYPHQGPDECAIY